MKYAKLFIGLIFCVAFLNGFCQRSAGSKRIEQLVAQVVDKAMASSVYLIEWDTLKNTVKTGLQENEGFSGVVVSADGHILTVSHAANPNEVYQVRFADGSRHIAKGLGRLGIQANGMDHDIAMVKILKPGKWSFAHIGRTTDLKLYQPLVSISYPGSFYKQTPNVRFGRLIDLDLKDGFITSTTKMEPGDSGGPLFNELGEVVGIHSWVEKTENVNYDVPAAFFLKYWTALNVAKDYTKLPTADVLPTRKSSVQLQTVPALEELVKISPQNRKSAIKLTSLCGTRRVSILGTLVNFEGNTYILSKSSMVGSSPLVISATSKLTAKVLKRDKAQDLVLLRADGDMGTGINLSTDPQGIVLKQVDLGKILISALSEDSTAVGVLSATYLDVPLNDSQGYLGAGAMYQDGKITIANVDRLGPAAALLKIKDQVIKINGIPVSTAEDYNREFARYLAGDSISLDILRGGKRMLFSFYLEGQPIPHHASFEYPGRRSNRSDGFKKVLVYDAAVKSTSCGSPVFDSEGRFYGINIARRSRTSTLLLPKATLSEFLNASTSK